MNVAGAVLACVALSVVTGCTAGSSSTQPGDSAAAREQRGSVSTPPPATTSTTPDGVESTTPARESLPCPAAVQRELVGTRHGIVGHSFAWPKPFRSPSLPDRHNKILWELQRPGRATDT